jgi:type III secretory pathway component EscS
LIVVLIQVGSGLLLRITSIRDDPFQTLRSLAVCGVLFVSAGLLSEEILRQSGSYLGQVRTFLQTLQPR